MYVNTVIVTLFERMQRTKIHVVIEKGEGPPQSCGRAASVMA